MDQLIRHQKGCPDGFTMTYPVADVMAIPTEGSTLESPRNGNPYDLPPPTQPEDAGFQAEFDEVLEVGDLICRGIWPSDFLARHHPEPSRFNPNELPELFEGTGIDITNPVTAAFAVGMDRPWDLPQQALIWLLRTGIPLKRPKTWHVETVGNHIYPMEDILDHLKRMERKFFPAKYYFGRPRPEAVAGVPGAIFTTYTVGCPNHPAYPAGHGALATACKVLDKYFSMTQAEKDQIFDAMYLWAQFRTLARVHYATDNLAGLALGGVMRWDDQRQAFIRSWGAQ